VPIEQQQQKPIEVRANFSSIALFEPSLITDKEGTTSLQFFDSEQKALHFQNQSLMSEELPFIMLHIHIKRILTFVLLVQDEYEFR
jgi:hypothetical protein